MQHWVLEYYKVCSNDDTGLTMTYFTARSNLIPYVFVWENVKTMDFSPGAVARPEACPFGMQAAPSSIPTSGTFFRGDFVMKKFLRPFSLFR